MSGFRFVILGAPGSGKGTISSRIVKAFNFEHVASGDKLRLHIQNKTAIGKEAQTYINKGMLVPDELMVNFITNELRNLNKHNWLLDGFPRTVNQAKALWDVQRLDLVLNLNVPFDVIIDRIKNRWVHLPSGRVYNLDFNAPRIPGKDDVTGEDLIQRKDDDPSVVLKRLEQYETLTKPVIDFYVRKGILSDFSGKTSDEIWPKIKAEIDKFIADKKSKL